MVRTCRNEEGFALIAVIMVLAALSVVGIAAVRTSTTETQIVRNVNETSRNYYNSEGAIISALETSSNWLTDAFLNTPEATANTRFASDLTANGTSIANVEVRCIYRPSSGGVVTIDALSDGANDIPILAHESVPPPGSGYSVSKFIVRRYAVTATAADETTQVQAGMWRIFNNN